MSALLDESRWPLCEECGEEESTDVDGLCDRCGDAFALLAERARDRRVG